MSGFVYPIGTKVKLAAASPDMLVVDLDSNSGRVCVSWQGPQRVEERWVETELLLLAQTISRYG